MKIARIMMLAVTCIGLAISTVGAQAQLWAGPGSERAGNAPAGHDVIGTWQALALSQGSSKDAWTSQSMKNDRLAAYNDTLSRCNTILSKMKLQPDCIAFASEKWVASYYCREGKNANFGEGDSPADAMNAAITSAGASRFCEFKAVRGPNHGMELMIKPWQATCRCGDRSIPIRGQGHVKVDSATLAVNNALTDCSGRGRFQVVELSLVQ